MVSVWLVRCPYSPCPALALPCTYPGFLAVEVLNEDQCLLKATTNAEIHSSSHVLGQMRLPNELAQAASPEAAIPWIVCTHMGVHPYLGCW